MTHNLTIGRNRHLTRGADIENGRGLEIGALNNAVVAKGVGQVQFVDYAPTEVLRRQHAHLPERAAGIVETDFVWPGSGSLAAVMGECDVIDYVIASHVIEHVPNTMGWFRGIAAVMKPGGVFNLAIPDKRYTFDVNCPVSTVGQLIEADFLNYSHPSVRQMVDHTWHIAKIEPGAIWHEPIDPSKLEKYNGDLALALCHDQAVRIVRENAYFDSHCWFYTPFSFWDLIRCAVDLRRFDLIPVAGTATERGDFEFFASFQRPEAGTTRDMLLARQREALDRIDAELKQARWVASLAAVTA